MRVRRRLRFAATPLALLLATALPHGARAEPERATVPVPPPAPPERPAELKPGAPAETPPAAGAALPSAAPLPPERPAELKPAEAPAQAPAADAPSPPPLPPARPAELTGEAALALKVAAPDDTACRRRLTRLGVAFEPLPAVQNGQCGAQAPLKITALGDGVALPQSATLVCGAAEALARWASEVQVAAERDLGKPLRGIAIGTSYECRGQNHDLDAKLSEHAFANGVDVMSFTLADRAPIPVAAMPDGTPEGRFLDAVRSRACGFFRTVLGPGSNAAHANHFHLDERERSGGHRLCQ
ncbi:extensin-like domain-containing protein [Methylobacterium sp. A54F]